MAIRKYLSPIEGHAPSPNERPVGCAFAARCTFATDICRRKQPELTQLKDQFDPHFVACHHSDHVGVINFKEFDHQVIERNRPEALLKIEHINA